jgi:hypothetical protein
LFHKPPGFTKLSVYFELGQADSGLMMCPLVLRMSRQRDAMWRIAMELHGLAR